MKYYESEVLIASPFSHQVSASPSRAKAAGRTISLLSRNYLSTKYGVPYVPKVL